ncbi:MAG: DUF5716 family protein [Bacillus sp. (in: Bacteria)]|nr:DUF5716 family protein [Bacillus sp. (in: firmicutes)]MCM1426956.1 DUF5716 family protein [Eubacterium sp.]
MFFDKKSEEKVHKGSILVGYDLGNDFSQISYCVYGEDAVESVATVIGTKQYHIPTVLCKRKGVNQWLYGKDALKNGGSEDGTLVTDLMELARKGEMITIEEEPFDPIALLALFIKRSLSLLNFIVPAENIAALMFTMDNLDDRMVEVLAKAAVNLHLKTSHIYFQSHTESFYYFVLHQPEELWNYQVLACEHNGTRLKTYRMERNKKTTPIVVLIEEKEHHSLVLPGEEEEEKIKADSYAFADEKFLHILEEACADRIVSSAYLLGDGFRDGWAKQSLQFLCRNRRVFQGNNLFCKGACYGLLEKIEPGEASKENIFLGPDKLKSNIGMNVIKRGQESYYALLDAGENWYEVHKECEFLLAGEENAVSFTITPLTGRQIQVKEIVLEGAPVRENAFGRYAMEIYMTSQECVEIKVTDLGFGELFPAGKKVWTKQFTV